jgi:lactoylglutathione lyase
MSKTAIVLLLSAAALLSVPLLPSRSAAPNKAPEFDHTTVHVRDLQKSAEFYEKVMGLERIADPFKDGKHIWFRAGAHEQLHIVGGATEAPRLEIEIHFAFRVASLSEFMAHLDAVQVKYRNFAGDSKVTVRPDGVRQIYLQDPDGYWIEVNESRF